MYYKSIRLWLSLRWVNLQDMQLLGYFNHSRHTHNYYFFNNAWMSHFQANTVCKFQHNCIRKTCIFSQCTCTIKQSCFSHWYSECLKFIFSDWNGNNIWVWFAPIGLKESLVYFSNIALSNELSVQHRQKTSVLQMQTIELLKLTSCYVWIISS